MDSFAQSMSYDGDVLLLERAGDEIKKLWKGLGGNQKITGQ